MSFFTYTIKYSGYTEFLNPQDQTIPYKTYITLKPSMVDTSTALVLPGHNKSNYGEFYNENLIRLMEHFASPNPPGLGDGIMGNPTTGQIWYQPYTFGNFGPITKIRRANVRAASVDIKLLPPELGITTGNVPIIQLLPGYVLDNVTLTIGDRVLLKNQTNPSENGVYLINQLTQVATRVVDMNVGSELLHSEVFVEEGTLNSRTNWLCTSATEVNNIITENTWATDTKYVNKLRCYIGTTPVSYNQDPNYPGWISLLTKQYLMPNEPECGDLFYDKYGNQAYINFSDTGNQETGVNLLKFPQLNAHINPSVDYHKNKQHVWNCSLNNWDILASERWTYQHYVELDGSNTQSYYVCNLTTITDADLYWDVNYSDPNYTLGHSGDYTLHNVGMDGYLELYHHKPNILNPLHQWYPVPVCLLRDYIGSLSVYTSQYAPLLSPEFIGIPTAPTALVGTNTTQIATTEFVKTEITVNELNILPGAGISVIKNGLDVTVSSTIANTDLSIYAPLNSPAFGGIPSGPTAVTGSNSTQLATTQFVQSEIAANAYVLPIASNITLGGIQVGSGLAITASGILSATYTLPTASNATLGGVQIDGTTITINSGIISAPYTYTLPTSSDSILGGIKIGAGLTIDVNGIVSAPYTYTLPTASDTILGGVKIDGTTITINSGVISAVIPAQTPYSLPTASTAVLGGVKVDGSTINIDGLGVISAIMPAQTAYSLPAASASTLGGIKVGSGLSIDGSGVLSSNSTSGIGVGQTWQNLIATRSTNTTYTNTTGNPIGVMVSGTYTYSIGTGAWYSGYRINGVDGPMWHTGTSSLAQTNVTGVRNESSMLIIPPGATYGFFFGGAYTLWDPDAWWELR